MHRAGRAGRDLRRLLRQATGEAKWDDYLAQCSKQGTEPISRREFERRRADHREVHAQSRCC